MAKYFSDENIYDSTSIYGSDLVKTESHDKHIEKAEVFPQLSTVQTDKLS